jgi:phospholipase B1
MSLGDSITAAFGLMGLTGTIEEYRGQSWCIGADPNATTLFNFFKTFTPKLIGGSLGHHVVEICIDPNCPDYQYQPTLDVLNAAQSGARVDDLAIHELDYLLSQLKANPNIDMDNDWKVLTILIGANDMCAVCGASQPYAVPANFETDLIAVLERVRTYVPRVFVNLVQMFNLSGIYTLGLQSSYCTELHKDLALECHCIFGTNGTLTRPISDTITQVVNEKMMNIQQIYKVLNDTDFAVVVQPFGRDTNVALFPLDYLSTLDCFHPSLPAHQALGIALWNNMLTPAATKKTFADFKDKPICPSANTLLYTY